MMVNLERLIEELRPNAENDLPFAERVAVVCCKLVEDKTDPVAAIRHVQNQ